MKFIHCADLHLDARMASLLGPEKAKMRRAEILANFGRIIACARESGCAGIFLAGDLFDTKRISAAARNVVEDAIRSHPELDFYYVTGNHEGSAFVESLSDCPANLHLFTPEWTTYTLFEKDGRRVTLSSREIDADHGAGAPEGLSLRAEDLNIVMLHGTVAEHANAGDDSVIALHSLRGKNIDYLALGHVHEYRRGRIDSRGEYCYSGCLEARGFDEPGTHGYILLTIDENDLSYEARFVRFPGRTVHVVRVDVSECLTTPDILREVSAALDEEDCGADDCVKVVLTGRMDVNAEKDLRVVENDWKERFYLFRLEDETKYRVDREAYAQDASLKGEYVRMLMEDESLTEDRRAELIRTGLLALTGEEIE